MEADVRPSGKKEEIYFFYGESTGAAAVVMEQIARFWERAAIAQECAIFFCDG